MKFIPEPYFPNNFIQLPDVAKLVGLPAATVDQLWKAGRFPQPVRLARHGVRWKATEVRRYAQDPKAWLAYCGNKP